MSPGIPPDRAASTRAIRRRAVPADRTGIA